ncbi:MAG: hypothetical protein ACREX1_08895 [Advenella sp.]
MTKTMAISRGFKALIKLPVLLKCLFVILLAGNTICFAATVDEKIQTAFDTMASTENQNDFYAAVRSITALGNDAVPVLTKRLIAAADDEQRVQISYVLGTILGQAKFKRETVNVPAELVEYTGQALLAPQELAFEANLANLAVSIAPHPAELVPGLLALLERTENEGLGATTSVAIGSQGDGMLPLVRQALLNTDNDRFAGDLAWILYDTELPENVIVKLQSLLKSDIASGRKNAARTLGRAGKTEGLLQAALLDLASAKKEMDLNVAAGAVKKYTDGSVQVAQALAEAFGRANRMEERMTIIDALIATGEPGKRKVFELIEAASDSEIVRDLMMSTNSRLKDDVRLPQAYLTLLNRSDNDNLSKVAIQALVMTGETGRAVVAAKIKDQSIDDGLGQKLLRGFDSKTAPNPQ